jgi:uncharacterized protein YchJ
MGVYDRQFGFERRLLVPIQPILAYADCCADALSGKAAAAVPSKAMNSRLFIVTSSSVA